MCILCVEFQETEPYFQKLCVSNLIKTVKCAAAVVAWWPYLDLAVVTDGFDGDGGSDGILWVASLELNNSLGPTH